MRITEVAKACGVSPWWIRRAESEGLIPAARRSSFGQRMWTREDLPAIEAAAKAHEETRRERWKAQAEKLSEERRAQDAARRGEGW